MSDFYPPHYPAHNFASPHEPYGHSYYPQPQAYPVERSLYTPQGQQALYTPQGQQSLYTPQGQHPSWDASKIWEEANGTPSASRDSTSLQTMGGGGGERGLGATVIGGGAGAFLGHELGHSKMATLGGVLVGAIAANAFEHHHKKKKEEKRMEHAYDDGYVHGESRSIDDGERSLSRRRSRSLSRDYAGRRSFSRASEGRRSFSRDYDRRSIDYDRRSEYDRRSSLSRDIEYDRRPASRDYDDRRSEFMESRTSLSREYDDEPRPHHHQHHHHAPRDYDDGYTAVSSRRDSRGDFYAQDDRYSRY